MHPCGLIGLFAVLIDIAAPQSFDQAYLLKAEWRFPNAAVSGYIWDAEVDDDGRLAIMFFKDGIT